MKKIIVIVLILMNVVSVNASSNIPKYKIVANSNSEKDIKKIIPDSVIKKGLAIHGAKVNESKNIVHKWID